MKDVADRQLVIARDPVDRVHHLGQPRARNAGVLDVVVRRDAADRAGRAFARGPQRVAFGLVARRAPGQRAVRARDGGQRRLAGRDVFVRAGDLDQQHRAGVLRIAGVKVRLDRVRDERVHDLERGRHDARADDRRDGLGGRLDVGERGDADAHGFGKLEQPNVTSVMIPSVPSDPTSTPVRS